MDRFDAKEQTICEIFSGQGRNFNIPVFQRPYTWGEAQCQKLWDDIKSFTIAEKAYQHIEDNLRCRYFLGPVVVYESDKATHQKEIIDGQQRTTTLMLLLRAFYACLVRKTD